MILLSWFPTGWSQSNEEFYKKMIHKEHVRMFWWKAQLYRVALWRLYHILEDLLQFLPLICDLSGSCLILPVFAQVVILHQLRYISFHHKKVSFIHESLKKRPWKTVEIRKKLIALSSCSRVVTLEYINGTNCLLSHLFVFWGHVLALFRKSLSSADQLWKVFIKWKPFPCHLSPEEGLQTEAL